MIKQPLRWAQIFQLIKEENRMSLDGRRRTWLLFCILQHLLSCFVFGWRESSLFLSDFICRSNGSLSSLIKLSNGWCALYTIVFTDRHRQRHSRVISRSLMDASAISHDSTDIIWEIAQTVSLAHEKTTQMRVVFSCAQTLRSRCGT